MHSSIQLISTLAYGLGFGDGVWFSCYSPAPANPGGLFICRYVARRYGFNQRSEPPHELAEVGVILLMFGVGAAFFVKRFIGRKALAIPGALLQIILATAWAMASPGFGTGPG